VAHKGKVKLSISAKQFHIIRMVLNRYHHTGIPHATNSNIK
jgi:hypothetical protein